MGVRLTIAQWATLRAIGEGEWGVIVEPAPTRRTSWRTLEALMNKGLLVYSRTGTEAHGQVTRRYYRLTDAGLAMLKKVSA